MAYIGNSASISQYAPQVTYFSGNGSTTAFTLPVGVVSSAQILVFVANVAQNPSSAYTVSGTTLTFTSAPPTGTNNVWVEYTSLQTNTIAPSAGSVNTNSFGSVTSVPFTGFNSIGTGNSSAMKNRIINGQFQISQYNGTSSATVVDGGMIIDRWKGLSIAQAGVFSAQQLSASPPVGYSNYLGFTSSGVTTPATGACFGMYQRIEAFNTSDLAWGTANAKTVTLSFWVQASIAGTYTGSIVNSAQSYSYPFSYTISSANTWQQVSITIAGPTAGTWISGTNGTGVQVGFSIGTGSTYAGTAGSWSANTYYAATGQTNLVGTSSATFYITGVQLEVGLAATGFEYRQFDTDLSLCQRYYSKSYDLPTVPGTITNVGSIGVAGNGNGSFGEYLQLRFQRPMRSTPTVVQYSPNSGTAGKIYQQGGSDITASALNIGYNGYNNPGVTLSASTIYTFHYTASAEL